MELNAKAYIEAVIKRLPPDFLKFYTITVEEIPKSMGIKVIVSDRNVLKDDSKTNKRIGEEK